MGSLLLIVSLMAVPLMILVAVGWLNWRDGRRSTHRSRQARARALAPTARHVRDAHSSQERVGVYLHR
ncbi:MAG: hypothetical protein ACLP4W_17315 [Mycobacterium sp.]|uniref:hypothetical protein n=1 Tax=Mycobacterium sp. TaxID=1785 RepID=UPI003F9E38DA